MMQQPEVEQDPLGDQKPKQSPLPMTTQDNTSRLTSKDTTNPLYTPIANGDNTMDMTVSCPQPILVTQQ